MNPEELEIAAPDADPDTDLAATKPVLLDLDGDESKDDLFDQSSKELTADDVGETES